MTAEAGQPRAAGRVGTDSHEALDLLGYLVPDLVESRGRRARLVQIGAHDGVVNDPVLPLIEADLVDAVLVEPIPAFVDSLRRLHAERWHIRVVAAAIAAEAGSFVMYQAVRPDGQLVNPRVTSLDRAVVTHELAVTRHFEPDLDPDVTIREVAVEAMTVETLMTQAGWPAPEVLVVDAEGHDFEIVRRFLSAGFVP
ncbi:MAG: FkbM family methyltransferase, partial [Myxococcota bacterium]